MRKISLVSLIFAPIAAIVFSLTVGAFSLSISEVFTALWGIITDRQALGEDISQDILLKIRGPRIVGACLVGAALAVSGACFQALFRNPLTSPYTLGVSNGAGFGAASAILIGGGTIIVQFGAITGALLAIGLTFFLGRSNKASTVTLLLSGLLVSSLFGSLISLMKFVADPFDTLPSIVFWLMGSLASADATAIVYTVPAVLILLGLVFIYRWRINVMSLDDDLAQSYGINIRRDRLIIVFVASVLAAIVISFAGIIGWVGIVVPHLARMLVGDDFRRLFWASISLGITFMVLIDVIARSATDVEIPIGVITGIAGIPLFMYLIYAKRVHF